MKLFGLNLSRVKDVASETGGVVKGWVDVSTSWYKPNWFQLGLEKPDPNVALKSSGVYACIATLSQELARLRISHYTNKDLKGRVEMYNSPISRLFARPNSYQTHSDFILYLMYSLLMRGNAYAYAARDARGNVRTITPLNPGGVQPYVTEDGDIFYSVAQFNDEPGVDFDPNYFVPQRDMLHVRLFTPTHPLIGVTPLTACMTSVAHGMSIQSEATRFFDNESKPAGILSTPKSLSRERAERIRDAWAAGTTGAHTGKVPVLDNDLKFMPMSLSAADSQIVEQYAMTKKDVAIVFRVPLYMVGEGESQFRTAEASQRDFVTRALGFYIEHLEAAFNNFFGFDGRTKYIEFDVERGIMRPEFNQRIEGLAKGIQGGLYSPNEARKVENLEAKEAGDNLFMQRQNVPINILGLDVLSDLENKSNESESSDDTDMDDDQSKSFDEYSVEEILNGLRSA